MASGQPPYYNSANTQGHDAGYAQHSQYGGYGSVQQPTTPSTSYPAPPAAHIFSMHQPEANQPYPQQGYGSNQYSYQQGYGQPMDYNQGYGMGNTQNQGFHQQGPPADQSFAIPGLNAPALNPMGVLLKGSSLFSGGGQWGQQYMQGVQQRMGWLSGGALNHQFAISNQYVMNKLLILLVPYFKRWSFSRQAEQIAGNHKYRPPRMDVNAPDLYIPLVSAWTYVMLLCTNMLLLGKYKPDIVYSKVWYAGCAWATHAGAAWVLLRMMSLPSALPIGELLAYTGYVFVPACCTLLVGMVGGKWAWWCAWMYGSLASAVFLVRTIKRVLFQETRSYGANLTLTNYLLLALAAMQFPLLLWLCSVQLPVWSLHAPAHASVVASPMSVKSSFMGGGTGAGAGMPSPARIG